MSTLNRRLVAAFGLVFSFCVVTAAQINGNPPSVTSIGFGGHFDSPQGVPPSVTSLGPQGYTPSHSQPIFTVPPSSPQHGGGSGGMHQGHHHPVFPVGGAVYPVAYPVYIVSPQEPDEAPAVGPPPSYPAGPTLFDRRASDQTSQQAEADYAAHMPPASRAEGPLEFAPPAVDAAQSAPEREQPKTVLVFRDGHQIEVQNYAIVGSTLFDLSSGRRTRIAISELDLAATTKQNDDRGVDFQLPVRPESN